MSDEMRIRNMPRGTAVKASKLNDDAVREIRKLREAGMTHAAIAAQFGVSDTTVRQIVHGRRWRHVA